MSQHYFRTTHHTRPIVVTMGWDRPLQYVFMTIERLDHNDTIESPYLYSNLDDARPHLTLTDYETTLAQLGITVPPTMVHAVRDDQIHNVGNKQVEYSPDGSSRLRYYDPR